MSLAGSDGSTERGSGQEHRHIPESLTHFLKLHGIDPDIYEYCDTLPRYIRLNPRCDGAETLRSLETELGIAPEPVPWLPGFHKLPAHVKIAGCESYRQGSVYGIDAASGAAVVALDPKPGEHVLELCTAPGGKLCMIADTLRGRGSATGVDLSEERVAACRNVLRKYRAQSCRLFRGDATTFLEPPPPTDVQAVAEKGSQRKRARERAKQQQQTGHVLIWSSYPRVWASRESNASRAKHTTSAAVVCDGDEAIQGGAPQQQLYDRVLVDAECTHDGSFKHIAKFEAGGWGQFEKKFLSRIATLQSLQRALLHQGFKLVRPGGVLVYSTCSMTRAQNEDVVQWLLREEPTARVAEIEQSRSWPCRPGDVPHSVRLEPKTSDTSALFICKLQKRPDQ